jgi:hypothetical protein
MAGDRHKKISTLIFLFAIFIMLAVFTGGWIYRMYVQQTAFSEQSTFDTVECGRYYFNIDPESVLYDNRTLYFEIENSIGAAIDSLVIESAAEKKQISIRLDQGVLQPVTLPIEAEAWVLVYPRGCRSGNFKNISIGSGES